MWDEDTFPWLYDVLGNWIDKPFWIPCCVDCGEELEDGDLDHCNDCYDSRVDYYLNKSE